MKLRRKLALSAAAAAAFALLLIRTAGTQPVRRGAGQTAPVLAGLDPNAMAAGSPAFVLTVYGAFFVGGSVVRWNGEERPTVVVNDTALRARIPASDVASEGTASVSVVNQIFATEHSGVSNVLAFRILPQSAF
jgi:hypothetical protein